MFPSTAYPAQTIFIQHFQVARHNTCKNNNIFRGFSCSSAAQCPFIELHLSGPCSRKYNSGHGSIFIIWELLIILNNNRGLSILVYWNRPGGAR
jgi:hypothetical protein